jgi:hypothetical protein
MPRKTTSKKVDRSVVLQAFSEVKQLSEVKVGQLIATLVRDNHVSEGSAELVSQQIQHAINESVNTILSSKGV